MLQKVRTKVLLRAVAVLSLIGVAWSAAALADGSTISIDAVESFSTPHSRKANVELASKTSTAYVTFDVTDEILSATSAELQLYIVGGKKPLRVSVVEFAGSSAVPRVLSPEIEVRSVARGAWTKVHIEDLLSKPGLTSFAVRAESGQVKVAAAGTPQTPRIVAKGVVPSSVVISAPADGAVIEKPGDVMIAVDGSPDISSVTVSVDGLELGKTSRRPFVVPWTVGESMNGVHEISAVGRTDHGTMAEGAGSRVTVAISSPTTTTSTSTTSTSTTTSPTTTTTTSSTTTTTTTTTQAPTPPTINLTEPAPGTRITESGPIRIVADVSSDVVSVDFFAGGLFLGSEESAPFEYSWPVGAADSGEYELSAIATTAAGVSTRSDGVAIVVDILGAPPTDGRITAVAETDPVPHGGDAADDAAIWVDSSNPRNSTVIGTDKLGGLAVYGLDGGQIHYYNDGRMNNVDLREGFSLGSRVVSLVAASDRDRDAIRLYEVIPATRALVAVGPGPIDTSLGLAGLCMYRSGTTGKYSVFVTDSSGTVQQWELSASASGVTGEKVRTIRFASTVEGCVADDVHGHLYAAEEDRGIWRLPAEPDSSVPPVLIDEVISRGGAHLARDVEGLAIFDSGGGSGYLIASSQGNDTFVVYDRRAPNTYAGKFSVSAGLIDEVTYTDGIDVTPANLGGPFGSGMFVAQDNDNGSSNQNFKLVPWSSIAGSLASPGEAGPGSDIYVSSTNGSDNNSGESPDQPWRSLSKAAAAVRPGETIHLERGSTWSEKLELTVAGTPDEPVLVTPYGAGPAPTIERQSTCVRLEGANITIEGMHIRNCSWSGVTISGDDNVVRGSRITSNAAGIYVKSGADGNTIWRNDLIDNNVMSVLTDGGSDDSGAFGILVHGDGTDIAYNTIKGSDAFSFDYGRDGAAIEIYGGRNNSIHHNHAADNDAFIEMGESRSAGNVVAYNVVTSSLETSVFLVTRGSDSSRGPVTGTVVDNNSVYFTGPSSQGFVCHGGCSRDVLTLRNNIIEARWKVGYADGDFNGDHNIFYRGQLQFTPGPHSVVADPRWRSPATGDFRLQQGSPGIDSGIGLGYTVDIGGSPVPIDGDLDGFAVADAGAFELQR